MERSELLDALTGDPKSYRAVWTKQIVILSRMLTKHADNTEQREFIIRRINFFNEKLNSL